MKKLILLFTTILLSSCSNNEDIDGALHGYKVTKDDFYLTQIGAGNSMKALISNTLKSGAVAVVEESVSNSEYKLNIKLNGMSFPQYYFKKISSTKIQFFDTAGKGGAIFIKQ